MEDAKAKSVIIPVQIPAILLLFPFFEPNGLSFLPSADRVFTILTALSLLAYMIFYLAEGIWSRLFLLALIWRGCLLISGLIARRSIDKTFLMRSAVILGLIMGIELVMRYNAIAALEAVYCILMVNLTINLVTCFAGGFIIRKAQLYFWNGMRTRFTDSIIPAVILAFLISWKRRHKLLTPLTCLTLLISGLQLVMEWVAAGILSIGVMLLFLIVCTREKQHASPEAITLIPHVTGFLIVFARIQNLFSFLIVHLLHKDLSFHGRVAIWDSFIEKITRSPFIGYGEAGNGGAARAHWSFRLLPAHNDMLQLLHDGGILGAGLLYLMLIWCAARLGRYRKQMPALLLTAGLLASGIEMIAEVSHYYVYFYILPVIAFHISILEGQEEERHVRLFWTDRKELQENP